MSISTEQIHSLDNVNLHFKKNKYPIPLNENLPRMFLLGLWCGSRGSGKTWSLCQMLKQYERWGIYDTKLKCNVDQRIILFSPTTSANPVFTSLKHLDEDDIIETYSDARLLEVINEISEEKEATDKYQRQMKLFKKFCKLKKVDDLSSEELVELELMGYEPPTECRYKNGLVTFLILDDLIGSSAFKQTGKSALTNLCLKNRHLGVNVCICCQSIKCIPKAIRTNTSLFIVFKFASRKIIVDDIYCELSNQLTIENFEKMLIFATEDDHDSLIIDFSQPKGKRFKKNWNTVLTIKNGA